MCADRVKAFLNFMVRPSDKPCGETSFVTRLEDHLSSSLLTVSQQQSHVTQWLPLLSRCGLDLEVYICMRVIVEKGLTVGPGVMTALREEHADKLASAWQGKLSRQALFIKNEEELRIKLQKALLPSTRFSRCPHCNGQGSVYDFRERMWGGSSICCSCCKKMI
jgi:hypothetical protein